MNKNGGKNKVSGLAELLGLLKAHPELVHALVVDHKKVKRLLKSKAARRLISGGARRTLQKRVAKAGRAGLIHADCLGGTRF